MFGRAVDAVVFVVVVVEGAELGSVEVGEAVSQQIGVVEVGLVEVQPVAGLDAGDVELLVLHEEVAAILQPGRDSQLVVFAVGQLVDLAGADRQTIQYFIIQHDCQVKN